MPEPRTGKLTEAEIAYIQKWVEDHAGGPLKCSVCGVSQWAVGQELTAPVALMPKPGEAHPAAMMLSLGGRVYPQIQILCTNCGNTMYFNTIIMGLSFGDWRPHEASGTGDVNG